jgi:hypothetical protein
VERAADERGTAGDRAAGQRAAATGDRSVVAEALGQAHADRRAERAGQADEQRGPRAGEVGGGEDRRQGGDRAVDQADQGGLDPLQDQPPAFGVKAVDGGEGEGLVAHGPHNTRDSR